MGGVPLPCLTTLTKGSKGSLAIWGFLSLMVDPKNNGFQYKNGQMMSNDWMIWGYPHDFGTVTIYSIL